MSIERSHVAMDQRTSNRRHDVSENRQVNGRHTKEDTIETMRPQEDEQPRTEETKRPTRRKDETTGDHTGQNRTEQVETTRHNRRRRLEECKEFKADERQNSTDATKRPTRETILRCHACSCCGVLSESPGQFSNHADEARGAAWIQFGYCSRPACVRLRADSQHKSIAADRAGCPLSAESPV